MNRDTCDPWTIFGIRSTCLTIIQRTQQHFQENFQQHFQQHSQQHSQLHSQQHFQKHFQKYFTPRVPPANDRPSSQPTHSRHLAHRRLPTQVFFPFFFFTKSTMSNKSIAVIGAGAAGLAATSYLLAEGFRVTLFEERSEPGGVWTRKDTTVHVNPIYDGLETNVPRTLMTFTDHPWRRSARMFPQDRTVKEYLKSYYEKINNSPEATANLNCQFDTTVLKLRRGRDRYQPAWKIESKSKAGESYLWSFDAVVVAGGNYSDPYTPVHEPGRQLWEGRRPGTILHSQQYQNPDKFRNKVCLFKPAKWHHVQN